MKWPLSRRAIPGAASVLARIGHILLMSIGAVASRAALLCDVRAGVRLVRAGVRCIGQRPRAGGGYRSKVTDVAAVTDVRGCLCRQSRPARDLQTLAKPNRDYRATLRLRFKSTCADRASPTSLRRHADLVGKRAIPAECIASSSRPSRAAVERVRTLRPTVARLRRSARIGAP